MENKLTIINNSSICDNHNHGTVGQFIKEKIQTSSKLSVVSAFFTNYTYDALREELEKIESLRAKRTLAILSILFLIVFMLVPA